ncbi:MAG: glycosyltransferase [Planctomycetes bacterium]|nr:glycosyltransferase [Planctomycetota bacterium]
MLSKTVKGIGDHYSARRVITKWQIARIAFYISAFTVFVLWDYKIAFTVLNFSVCGFYGAAVGFRLLSAFIAFFNKPEIQITQEQLAAINDNSLPLYTVLIPLYKEANITDKIMGMIDTLDYPKDRLDVKILLEEEDKETQEACASVDLPSCCEVIVIPDGQPRTKPRACNYGLECARGKYLVIFDAEDRPDPDQLKKAVIAFSIVPDTTACLQAKLNYYNPDQNFLTRFFTLEYTAWFDLFLPGLHRMGLPIPLGGTSNHFHTDILKQLGGWDAFNVAEDCDLGIRLTNAGHNTKVIDSTTWEEANSRLWNWVRQRSRWVKGYIQTHLVHTRSPLKTFTNLGAKNFAGFFLSVGGLAGVLLLNPLYWLILTLWGCLQWKLIYFDYTDETEQYYTVWSQLSWVFFVLAILLFASNFALILLNILACQRRRLWRLLPYAILAPLYWGLISLAAWKGALQLIRKPHYWEKTEHGLDSTHNSSSR